MIFAGITPINLGSNWEKWKCITDRLINFLVTRQFQPNTGSNDEPISTNHDKNDSSLFK